MKAKTLLGLRETSSLKEIKNKYKFLMKKWHPDKHSQNQDKHSQNQDKHSQNQDKATKMSMQINDAYEIVLDYCNNYEYPFDENSIKQRVFSPSEWWHDKFGGR